MMNRPPQNPESDTCPTEPSTDRGASLIEIVIAVVLLGLVVVPLMAAVRTSIQVSTVTSAAAKAETAMVNAADRVNRAPLACDYLLYAQASVQTEGWPKSAASVKQEWYNPDTNQWVDEGPLGDACEYNNPTNDIVQRVSITVQPPDSDIRRSIQVIKSNV